MPHALHRQRNSWAREIGRYPARATPSSNACAAISRGPGCGTLLLYNRIGWSNLTSDQWS